ncbi:MAG: HupE/UreJ family protein [Gammaproteobacteria bacterium]|nr:HupE/UreJ family protein [Gammaproteobacteria bacterium]
MIVSRICFLGFVVAVTLGSPVHADELRPGLLEIKEISDHTYDLMWKTSNADRLAGIGPELPGNCTTVAVRREFRTAELTIATWQAECPGGLEGKQVGVNGLAGTSTDVLVRIERIDGSRQIARLTAAAPSLSLAKRPGLTGIAITYMNYGITHIMGGYDHLLFVLALILLVGKGSSVLLAVTAFTVSHSVTLAIAALGLFRPAQSPIEAVIALSILFLAVESERKHEGHHSITIRYPWIVALLFGLLHGFGFAGALLEAGLPQHDVPAALLFFNVGVEVGQVLFIIIVLALAHGFRGFLRHRHALLRNATQRAIGVVAAFWTIERVSGFW